jgi:protein-tyrosine phosphatase
MGGLIADRFGSTRGLVRLALSWPERLPGLSREKAPRGDVRRLVFVCHGNICRSAYADVLARSLGAESASFGLSTTSGLGAHPPVAALAEAAGLSLADHRTTSLPQFHPREGDLLLAMEHRHLRRLAADPQLRELPRLLLGAFASPPLPHLHDPFEHEGVYMERCLARIDGAVRRLVARYPAARLSPPSP